MRTNRPILVVLVCIILQFLCAPARAVDPASVLVLYNTNPAVPESLQIANYYKQVYPDVNLLGLNLGTASTITATDYLTNIRDPVLAAWNPSTDLIVTTKGMPLQIHVEAANPGSYSHPADNSQIVWDWKTESSLESELSKIDYIANEVMMGDQSFNQPIGGDHFTKNLYYQSTASFSAADFSGAGAMRLTARLDGFSVADVTGAIDRAQNAFVGPLYQSAPTVDGKPSGPFSFLVDADSPGSNNQIAATTMTNLAENVLPAAGVPLTYENTGAFEGTADGPVLGYVSHGANQASTPGYVSGVGSYIATALDIALADGAVFNTWESFNAQSFEFGGNSGNQGLVAEWLAKGGTAGVGNVDEPEGSPSFVFNEDLLFSMLLDGKTFAEAAWSSARQLSHVNTVVGDPLMTWKVLLPGDANMDGVVDVGDLAVMGALGTLELGRSIDTSSLGWSQGDLNGDGFIDMLDVDLVGSSWGQISDWSTAPPPNLTDPTTPMAMALLASMHASPEPSSVAMMSIGLASLAAFTWCRRRKSRRAHSSTI